jgi:hypothetical protein
MSAMAVAEAVRGGFGSAIDANIDATIDRSIGVRPCHLDG